IRPPFPDHMHQQPRGPPRVSSPARTTRPSHDQARSRAGSNVSSARGSVGSPATGSQHGQPPVESVKKLDQIVQNFFNKAAVLIIDSRMRTKPTRSTNGSKKPNKWFQLDTLELDDFRDELRTWRTSGSIENQPPPLIIEVYLDTSRLKDSQSLTIVDDDGKRWDVMEQLGSLGSYTDVGSSSTSQKNTEVIIERWRVDLQPKRDPPSDDFGPILPTIYKKAIVFFRSFFTTTRVLPAWKFASQDAARNPHPALTPRCRIRTSLPPLHGPDPLRQSIDGRDAVTDYVFGDLDIPVGRLSTSVTYRNDCSFHIDDSESLLSSRFMGVDEDFFKPSLPQRARTDQQTRGGQVAEVVSLRENRPPQANVAEAHQTYGSLSTFHGNVPMGTSPMTALRSVRPPGSDTSSPPTPITNHGDSVPSGPLPPARAYSSRPGTGVGDGLLSRRPSISFQPFKAGSLSGSPVPRQPEPESPASPHSSSYRASGPPSLQQPRARTSLTAGMPASLRGGPPAQPADAPSSPRPSTAATSRYSSSFTHRRGRLSIGGAIRAGDDEQGGSSGRQSLSSSVAQPGSGLLAEPGTSSGSFQAEEDNISEFLKALDSKKTLKSFDRSERGESATNKTVAQLSKFHMMKDSNNALTESMTSSVQMHRSSSTSSRQLTSVPGMVAPASVSASSSPSKPHSPHTPHTPAIPSRLSEHSTADQPTGHTRTSSRRFRPPAESTVPELSPENTVTQDGTTAIDIPLSPRLAGAYQRRSNSVQQGRTTLEDDYLPFAPDRSASLGTDDREPPTMSGLLGQQLARSGAAAQAAEEEDDDDEEEEGNAQASLRPAAEIQPTGTTDTMQQHGSSGGNPSDGFLSGVPSSSPFGRRRYTGMNTGSGTSGAGGRRQTPPQSARGSFTGSIGRLAREDNDSLSGEPLMFDLSEMDAQGRRSLEEGRQAGNADRGGGYDSRGGGASSSRRGW
ncbi:autophagy-related protein 13, partial [Geosmithia morbida]